MANILFAQQLHRRLQASGYTNIYVNSLNPGKQLASPTFDSVLSRCDLGTVGAAPGTESAALPPMLNLLSSSIVRLTSIPPEDGTLTTLLAATDPEIKAKALSGRYFDVGPLAGKFYYGYSWDATDSKMSDLAKDKQLAENLWDWSVSAMQTIDGLGSTE